MPDDDYSITGTSFDITHHSLTFSFEWDTYDPPQQQDMFRHYIQSQWLHSSHLAEEDPQWQIQAWIDKQPHIKELYQEGTLEIDHHDTVEYYHRATEQEHFAWRLRWSELIENQKLSIAT